MKKGLAMLLVLGIVAQEGWANIFVGPAIGGAVGGAVAAILSKKQRECNNSKSVNRETCQGQDSGKAKGGQRREKKRH